MVYYIVSVLFFKLPCFGYNLAKHTLRRGLNPMNLENRAWGITELLTTHGFKKKRHSLASGDFQPFDPALGGD